LKKVLRNRKVYALAVLFIGILWFIFCLPEPLFLDPYSTVVNAKNGELLGAKIATDGQWRFPQIEKVPKNFEQAIITYEDKRFYHHTGVDYLALARAMRSNISEGRIVSGASTLSMQVIRLSRKNKPRTFYQKFIEIILAQRLEFRYSKEEILQLYASHAPFGGNVVGLEAATWRYYKKPPENLSIAEGAMLAVLPNSPSLIHLAKNREALLEKRNLLLGKMLQQGIIDQENYELALLERIPEQPHPLPRLAPHLVEYCNQTNQGKSFDTQISPEVQQRLLSIANSHHHIYKQSGIHNLAILVINTKTGEVEGYVGNAPNTEFQKSVDIIHANRSSGSVLKPLLYASMLEDGMLNPKLLWKDIPTNIQGYNPENYNRSYSGAVSAEEALSKSLNIPAVYMLQRFGINPFLLRLKKLGFTSFTQSADHYGLSLILGGGEVNLWELTGAYAAMGRKLLNYPNEETIHLRPIITDSEQATSELFLSSGSIYHTFKAMLNLSRPEEDGHWQNFNSSQPVAWKTGTSFGHRDAWAVGVTPKYTIGVWVGNADGTPSHDLVGVKKAGPILFDVLGILPSSSFFKEPIDDLYPKLICQQSGFPKGKYCEVIDTLYLPSKVDKTNTCPYHQLVHLDGEGNRVHANCESSSNMLHKSWFVLPPEIAYYYQKEHPEYSVLPPMRSDCESFEDQLPLSFIYPSQKVQLYLPIDRQGDREKAIFKAAHIDPDATLFWHLDKQYIGETATPHTIEITGLPGQHQVKIVDDKGYFQELNFEILGN